MYTVFIQVLQEIVELEKYCELLKKCIKEKEGPLKVAHTRLVTRVSRPGVEACKDSAQYKYITPSSYSLFPLFLSRILWLPFSLASLLSICLVYKPIGMSTNAVVLQRLMFSTIYQRIRVAATTVYRILFIFQE